MASLGESAFYYTLYTVQQLVAGGEEEGETCRAGRWLAGAGGVCVCGIAVPGGSGAHLSCLLAWQHSLLGLGPSPAGASGNSGWAPPREC